MRALGEIAFDQRVRDGGDAVVDLLDTPGVHVDGSHVVAPGKQAGERKPDIT